MMNIRMTSLLLAGLVVTASANIFAASGDGAEATGTQSGGISSSTFPPDNTPGSPAGGTSSDTHGSGTGTDGGASGSGSGAGGGTGSAGGGTGGAGGGTGSSTHKSNP
ncbi:hypothetical protein JFT92_05110 [Pseudomonas sp. TH35]|uniref:Uncharacterized protein n=2 Tax=Pseudomonadota TaxID=1224 RepID=A0ABS6Q1X5_9PSED|nr:MULTISPECIES: hypothetical protein [Pseudomonas]MBK5309351.1 hypothetical protein [Pseudomonas sp. TH71]MBK5368555.1 hypothetical protein [Pseudomonas sp. TH40]MBK5379724.1 hypothetical protein [Pseudomonas sp. TH35]MBK5385183.1 hypothetical protein [Pseudomonas sp. TH38]MBK5402478.1 hypothetical protein [Pseudomonas sp. TH37]